jgi:epoxyqueuosine reductase
MISDILKNNLIPSDEYIFGTSDLTGLIPTKFGEYRFGISIGKRLDDAIIDTIANGPTTEYYEYYNYINKELYMTAKLIRNKLQKVGIDSIIIRPTISTSSKEFEKYLSRLTVDISHKMVATRAGLGWIGKTDLLISKKFGPRLRLVSLLINQKPDNNSYPIDKSRCGTCNICVDKCPAQAANGLLWNIKTHRDTFFNAHKCRDKCGELAKQRLNVDKRICGICISVCPVGKKKISNIPYVC